MENSVKLFKGANWVTLSGSFTPEELRELADKIEKEYKDFQNEYKI